MKGLVKNMMKEAKITKKMRYESMIEILATIPGTEDLREFCAAEIELLERKTAKAKEYAAKRKSEADVLMTLVKDVLSTEEFMTINQVTEALDNEEYTSSKVKYRLGVLVKDQLAEKAEITVELSEGKTTKAMGYRKLA